MNLPDLDRPDDSLGRQDPFVTAVRIWSSLENMRAHGFPEDQMEKIIRSMDAVLIRHRRTLVEQYAKISPSSRTLDLRRRLGLEHWDDGEVLAQHDPDTRSTA